MHQRYQSASILYTMVAKNRSATSNMRLSRFHDILVDEIESLQLRRIQLIYPIGDFIHIVRVMISVGDIFFTAIACEPGSDFGSGFVCSYQSLNGRNIRASSCEKCFRCRE